ncbi:MAG: 1-acyl-sn-glycerol-3-phosphate acyltransferase, partial [Leptospiraceae bacterium]|nr:1-acyl-sn-glycerol-3-phosphate acyltransferase [Leptospiraceae bacterium]
GNIIGQNFLYMASRQVFTWQFGAIGWFIRRMGAYSIIAGTTDREALKMSRSILAAPEGKLAIYPEGEPTSGENDNLMPFQAGVAQIGFWGLEDARKNEPDADITVVQAFMKYTLRPEKDQILKDLDKSLSKIEKKLKLVPEHKHLLHRFLTVGRVLLERAEKEYNVTGNEGKDFDYRVGRVRHAMLDQIADRLNAPNYDYHDDAIMKWRRIFAYIEMLQLNLPELNLPKVPREVVKWAHKESIKVFDFIVIKRDYILEYPSGERLYEWLDRYESYLFNKTPRALGGVPSHLPRTAHVFFAKPFQLSEYFPADKKERRKAVDQFTIDMRKQMQELLNQSKGLSQPLFSADEVKEVAAKIKR